MLDARHCFCYDYSQRLKCCNKAKQIHLGGGCLKRRLFWYVNILIKQKVVYFKGRLF